MPFKQTLLFLEPALPITCNSSPSIVDSESDANYNEAQYKAENALTYEECEVHGSKTYQIFKNDEKPRKFVIDMGCQLDIKEFKLRNTKNGHFNDRFIIKVLKQDYIV